MIYLDNAATTPVNSVAAQKMLETLTEIYGNPSSTHQVGQVAQGLLNDERSQLAKYFGVSPRHVYFTSGATEANNWALRSQAWQMKQKTSGNHLVMTAIEHPSNQAVVEQLTKEGFIVTVLLPNQHQQYTVDQFIEATTSTTIGWIAMAVNNETGAILPVQALGVAAQEQGVWFHVDAVQAIGKVDCDWKAVPFNTLTLSGHKFHGPKGVGALIYRPLNPEDTLEPWLVGGGQEHAQRAGTENLPGIVGMGAALRELSADHYSHAQTLATYFYEQLTKQGIKYVINGDPKRKTPFIHNLWLKGLSAEMLLIQLDLAGIAVSAGSACSAGSLQPSQILQAYYPAAVERLAQSIRISFGYQTTKAELDQLIHQLGLITERMLHNGKKPSNFKRD